MRPAVAALAIIVSATLLFAAGMNLPSIGARAISMGGAYRALSNDGSAVYWNPAGLAMIGESQATLSGQYMLTYSSYNAHDTLRSVNRLFREGSQDKIDRSFIAGSLFGVFKPKSQCPWSFGLGVYSPTGVGSTWDVLSEDGSDGVGIINPRTINPSYPDSDFVMSTTELMPERDFRGVLATYTISPAAAYSLGEISLGASLIYTNASLDIVMPSTEYDRMQSDTGVVFQSGEFLGESYGFNLGILYSHNERLRFGGNFKYQTSFAFEGDYSETIYKFYNRELNNLGRFFGDTVLAGGVLVKPSVRAKAELDRPIEFGIGASYRLSTGLLLAMDLSYTGWSVIDTIRLFTESGRELVSIPMNWENTYRLSLGGDYSFSRYSARFGAFYEPNPPKPAHQNLFIPDMNNSFAFAGGFSARFGRLTTEISFEAEFFGETVIEPAYSGDYPSNLAGKYTGSVADFALSTTYRF